MTQKVEDYNKANTRKPAVVVGIAAQGSDNQLYLLGMDETTGKLAVDVSVTSSPDVNIDKVGNVAVERGYSAPGTGSLRVAAMLGVGSAAASVSNPVPMQPIVGGAAVDPRAVRALTAADVVTVVQGSAWAVSQSGTWSVTVSNPITGFALETTASAMSAKLPATLGQKTMAASLPVVLASDQGTLTVNQGAQAPKIGRTCHTRIFFDYSVTNVTTGAFVQILASLGNTIDYCEIFDSSGQALTLALGAAASETAYLQIFPGGNGPVPVVIPTGNRLSLKAITATANTGFLLINGYSN